MILRETEKAKKNKAVQKDANNLIKSFLNRNTNPGKGSKFLFDGVYELRGESGAWVYYKSKGDTFEILGKFDNNNQDVVINRLKKLYGKYKFDKRN